MKHRFFRGFLCAALCLVLALSAAGCQAKGQAVNLMEKLSALTVSDRTLGIEGAFTALSDITDGKADPALVGRWVSADGRTAYTYAADGTERVESEDYGSFDTKFTCITREGYRVLCEEAQMTDPDAEGGTAESTVLAYTAYRVENDVLYLTTVERAADSDVYGSFQAALVMMFRTDASGSPAAAIAKNPIALDSLNGTWSGDTGDFTIENGTLKTGSDSFALSFDERNRLVAEKDGQTTAYGMNIIACRTYGDWADKTVRMGLYYTGADESDKPNLLPLLDDWKTEYGWEDWYYTGGFELQ